MAKEIMVVPRDKLFAIDYFEGFKPAKLADFESRILSNYKYMSRDIAENDPSFKQPIAYCVIVNNRRVFTYQRAKKTNESRLVSKWSIGIGGHIEKNDLKGNPIQTSMLRELKEEIKIKGKIRPEVLGYINFEKNGVGKVHFGILYIIKTDSEKIVPKQEEIADGEFRTLQELNQLFKEQDFEHWSRIAFQQLSDYLQ